MKALVKNNSVILELKELSMISSMAQNGENQLSDNGIENRQKRRLVINAVKLVQVNI